MQACRCGTNDEGPCAHSAYSTYPGQCLLNCAWHGYHQGSLLLVYASLHVFTAPMRSQSHTTLLMNFKP
jgi:hypothetical protein